MSFKKNNDITYTIYASNIVKANHIKEELIVFYKQYCYSFSLFEIDKNIINNLDLLPYEAHYNKQNLIINSASKQIKMTGYLFTSNPSSIDFKYYFSMVAVSMPEAISTKVATSSLSDQIW